MGTKYTIFDNGVNPERSYWIPDNTRIREELGVVCYVSILAGAEMRDANRTDSIRSEANWNII